MHNAAGVVAHADSADTLYAGELEIRLDEGLVLATGRARSVDVYLSKLRGKLGGAMPDRHFIHTHQGFGYRFQPASALAAQCRSETGNVPPAGAMLSRNLHTETPGR